MAARDCNCSNVARTCTAQVKVCRLWRENPSPQRTQRIPFCTWVRARVPYPRLRIPSKAVLASWTWLTHDKRWQLRRTSNASINLHRHLRPFAKSASAAPLDRGVEVFWSFNSPAQSQCDRSETQACCGWSVLFVGKLHLVLQEVCQVGGKRPYTFRTKALGGIVHCVFPRRRSGTESP